jgi:hypothetical protein
VHYVCMDQVSSCYQFLFIYEYNHQIRLPSLVVLSELYLVPLHIKDGLNKVLVSFNMAFTSV